MDDVRGRFLGLPHGITPAAVTTNKKLKKSSFKSSENIQKKEIGPDRSVSDNQSSSSHGGVDIYVTAMLRSR